jgi:lysophospholipase L1-like esterase
MTTLSKARRLRTLVGASILVASATVFGALPAQAAPGGGQGPASEKASYAALGDSYAAGVGGGEYLDACLTSPNGYAADLADDPSRTQHSSLRGCVGATVEQVVATQLAGLDLRTRLVTLTVGANDLGLAAITAACLFGTVEQCAAAVGSAEAELAELGPELVVALAAVRDAAPKATVVVTGYPLLLDGSVTQAGFVNAGIMELNEVIASAVALAGEGFVYVDVVSAFADHGIGSLDPWIHEPSQLFPFHPTAEGYAAYADAIRAAL